jgi:hypothetical protein
VVVKLLFGVLAENIGWIVGEILLSDRVFDLILKLVLATLLFIH